MKARNVGFLFMAIAVVVIANTANAQCSGGGRGGSGATGTTTAGIAGTTSGSVPVNVLAGDSFAANFPVNAGAQMAYLRAMNEQAALRQSIYKQQLARRMRNEALKSESDELLPTKKDRLFAQQSKSGKSNASSSKEKLTSK